MGKQRFCYWLLLLDQQCRLLMGVRAPLITHDLFIDSGHPCKYSGSSFFPHSRYQQVCLLFFVKTTEAVCMQQTFRLRKCSNRWGVNLTWLCLPARWGPGVAVTPPSTALTASCTTPNCQWQRPRLICSTGWQHTRTAARNIAMPAQCTATQNTVCLGTFEVPDITQFTKQPHQLNVMQHQIQYKLHCRVHVHSWTPQGFLNHRYHQMVWCTEWLCILPPLLTQPSQLNVLQHHLWFSQIVRCMFTHESGLRTSTFTYCQALSTRHIWYN